MSRKTFRARWVLPITSPPIENGQVVVESGRIAAVEPSGHHHAEPVDCGDALILPGLVNAHTHLELTICRGRVPFDGSFVAWIERLASLYPREDEQTDAALRQSIRDGLSQSLAAGVTTVADIGTGRRALEQWRRAPVRVVGFLETLGMGPRRWSVHERSFDRVASLCREAKGDPASRAASLPAQPEPQAADTPIESPSREDPLLSVGIEPHAPYSTDREVYHRAIELARQTQLPICTHLAETRDELRFLADGTGPFHQLLASRGLWDGTFQPPTCSPVEYAHRLGLLTCPALLIHVNYASDADLERLAASPSSVVFCPRSHQFFGHPPHRYPDMLARGINVCIGTDSLASNCSLSVLDELRSVRSRDAGLSGPQLLRMGTMSGARALGVQTQVGSLEPGKRADLVIVPMGQPAAREPIEDLLASKAQPATVYLGGQKVWGR